jgi:diguanylate cyclase (GGDEF)-like protein
MTQEQVRIMAYFDPLTKLANRNQLYQYIEEEIPRLQKDNDTLAIMFLDLDRFKIINDTFGHGFGDLLLKEASKRLNQCMNEQNKLFRYGGDEYIVITKYKEIEDVEEIAQCIIDKLEKPFTINARQTYVTTSIGISLYPKDGETVEELIQTADSAMYRAKENGKNNYQFYKSSFNSNNQRKIDLENGMRKALEQNDFILFYQPQVELLSGNIIGLEALIRWEHPEYGFISPGEFIPIAEETGLIIPIGKWVLKEACKQNKIWQKKGINCMQIAVNVSPLQFKDKNFIKTVKEIMNETEMNASCLELEITESTTRDVEEAMKVMEELKELGVNLAIDDFGTGYSSLNYLRYFPIKKLKIDKSFVDEIGKNFKGEAVIKTIIKLGNDLGFNVMAEGIEKDEQVLFLQQNNCQCGQGYFFYKPLSVDEVEKVLK